MGGVTVTEALKAGLLDEIVINQRPVLLGGGHPFFHELPDAIQLECTSVAVNSGVVHLTYRVLKWGSARWAAHRHLPSLDPVAQRRRHPAATATAYGVRQRHISPQATAPGSRS